MIHLLVIFLLLIFMALMVGESSIYIRAFYFIVCVILLAVYNVVHAKGLEMSLKALISKRPPDKKVSAPAPSSAQPHLRQKRLF